MSLLEIDDLSVRFTTEGKAVDVVRGVSLSIEKGELLALVGESGSGNSMTALSIPQLLPYPHASHPTGSIRLEGVELMGAPPEKLREVRGGKVGVVFQEPMTSLNPLHTIERQIGETIRLHQGLSGRALRARTIDLLRLVQLDNATDRLGAYPHQLSGGQRQRVMIAIAMANEPDLLIADEPTTALDVTIQAEILKLIRDLRKRIGMGVLLITHDMTVVRRVADTVCVMTRGEIVERGPVERVLNAPKHDYTRHLLASEPKGRPAPVLPTADSVLACEDVRVHFGLIKAVDGVSLEIRRGQTVGVVGESGSGKSTLGLAVLRLLESKGRIAFLGKEIGPVPRRRLHGLRRQMQIVFQDPYSSLSPRMTVREIISEGLDIHNIGEPGEERRERVKAIMREVRLDPAMMDRYPHEFSGGQRQRISIARVMVLKPDFVVLDEPTSALDLSVQAQIVELLRDLQRVHNLSYLFISLDLRVVRSLCNFIVVMRAGKVVEKGPAEAIFEHSTQPYTKALIQASFDIVAQ
jgi:microcin C transport system ATP-binding protein